MSAQPSSFALQFPPHVFARSSDARRTKREHQQLAHFINRMLSRLGVPDKAARGVVGIHGALNGREIGPDTFIAHKWVARQLHFRGKEENSDVMVGRVLDAIRDAEQRCGRRFFLIRRASASQLMTSYEADYIGEAALWGLYEARASAEWKKHPAKAITDELVDAAIAKLPECEPQAARDVTDGPSITDNAVIKGLWTKVDNLAEAAMRKITEAGGDPLAELEAVHRRQRRIAVEIQRERLERERREREQERETDPPGMWGEADGKNISDTFAEGAPPQFVGGADAEGADYQGVSETGFAIPPEEESERRLDAALKLAAEGTPILAVWGVCDGICDCPKGDAEHTIGKHPHGKFCPNGVYSATTDAATIRRWHAIDPRINFGEAMGEVICIDVDPRNGGDATYFDLEQAHGEFPPTREKRTGGGGWHKKYKLPETIKAVKGELKCKLGPGVDVKAAGGYVLAPGSSHASGHFYGFENDEPIAEAPEWIVETLKKAAAGESPLPIDFQEYRDRRRTSAGGARFFGKGERNDGLRDVMLGRWTHGFAEDASDLYQQMLEVRDTRCEHDPADPPPSDREIWDLVQRTVRNYARGERAARREKRS